MFFVLKSFFDKVKYPAVIIIIFFILLLLFNIIYPYEAFAMDPYDNMTSDGDMSSDEDMISDNDLRNRLIISRKETYTSYSGNKTYFTRGDLFDSLYPTGLLMDSSIINDSYDNENYFDIPLTMIRGESKNELSDGLYSGCMSSNIDGLLIGPERSTFQVDFVKDYTQVLSKDSNIPSVSLGARVMDRVVFVYIKCQDVNKQKYQGTIGERTHITKYGSYKTFKKHGDSEINVGSNIDDNIRKDIIIELKDLLELKTIDESLRKSVRSEIKELIRKNFLSILSNTLD